MAASFGVTRDRDIAPSAFIIDRRGRARWSYVGDAPEDQPTVRHILDALGGSGQLPIPVPSDVLTPVVVAVIVMALALLGVLAAVADRDLLSWDAPVRDRIVSVDAAYFDNLMEAMTKLGSRLTIAVLTLPTVAVAWRRCKQLAVLLAVAFPAALVAELALKAVVDRPRPALAVGFGASFPSGHVLAATAFWGLVPPLIYLLTRRRWAWALSVGATALVLIGVGTSRVYVGAHWPSDVVGAYLAGAVFLLVAEWVVRRPWRRFHCDACDFHPLLHPDSAMRSNSSRPKPLQGG